MLKKEKRRLEPEPWVATDIAYVWRNTKTGKFVYSDEAGLFSNEYPSKKAAAAALQTYIKFL